MSGCTASGNYAVAEGGGTTASGTCSHAEGGSTIASGSNSHAEGYNTIASGSTSHAEGNSSMAYGANFHAEGWNTIANGDTSHVEGGYTKALNIAEHASGMYNISLSSSSTFGYSGNTLFTVGNGNGTSTTHNALQLMQNGDIYIADTSGEGQYYEKPMINLINRISELETKVATLITKAEVEKGFNNVITVENGTHLKIRNNALEDESAE